MRPWRVLLVAAAAIFLAACEPSLATYTVSGTMTISGLYVSGNPAVVTATDGSNSYTVSVAVAPDNEINQSVTYSLSGVPAGTYTVALSIVSGFSAIGNYTLNGVGPTPAFLTTTGSGFSTIWTMTVNGVSIGADVLLDALWYWNS
jgi:hypothetical protein